MLTATAPSYLLNERATDRLLADCLTIGALLAAPRPSARERLERDLGSDQVERLVTALAGDHRMRVRELELVG